MVWEISSDHIIIKYYPLMKIITDISKLDLQQLDKYVFSHPHGNIFQTSMFLMLHKNYSDSDIIIIVLYNEAEDIIAYQSAIILRESSKILKKFSSRAIIFGGPLLSDEEIHETLIKEYDKIAGDKVIYTQHRNLFDSTKQKEIFLENNYNYEEHLNIIIDLTRSEEELWGDIHSKRRNEIRRAVRESVEFKLSDDENDINHTYGILKEVYKRAGLPLPKQEYFEMAYKILRPDHFKIFLALYDGKIIGTMYTLCYKNTIYDWYAGSYQAYYNKYPNDLIPWKVFLWGKENGFHTFDFGGAGKPNVPYGVRDYKKKFGGRLVNYGRFMKINNPAVFKISSLGLKVYQLLK